MSIKKVNLVFNIDDPEQLALYKFVNFLPNGKKRNTSAFLRTLVDREFQKQKSIQTANNSDGVIRFRVE